MNVSEISLDPKIAEERFKEYRTSVRERSREEDIYLMKAYKALWKGKHLIDLALAFKSTGVDHRFRPKLAIVRADSKHVFFQHTKRGGGTFSMDEWYRNNATMRYVKVPDQTFAIPPDKIRWEKLKAIAPHIPPRFLPKISLTNYHVLWEAEWEEMPPRDPMLLKRVAPMLFVVLATWDLTEIEMSVLRK